MKVRDALNNIESLTEGQIRRLEESSLVSNGKLTEMGKRFAEGRATDSDLQEFRKLIRKWYCYYPPRLVAKSPIDCGDR